MLCVHCLIVLQGTSLEEMDALFEKPWLKRVGLSSCCRCVIVLCYYVTLSYCATVDVLLERWIFLLTEKGLTKW